MTHYRLLPPRLLLMAISSMMVISIVQAQLPYVNYQTRQAAAASNGPSQYQRIRSTQPTHHHHQQQQIDAAINQQRAVFNVDDVRIQTNTVGGNGWEVTPEEDDSSTAPRSYLDVPQTKQPPTTHPKTQPKESPATDDWRSKCAQRCEERNMDVTGVGVQAIATDKAEVRASVEYRRLVNTTNGPYTEDGQLVDKALTALISSVQQEVSRKAAKVVTYLQQDPDISSHIFKLRTSTLTLEPLYEYINNRMVLTGYRGTNSITFRVDIAFAGQVVDAIVEQGVTRIDGVAFVASPKELNDARQAAIANAVEDAISQALSALSGLGSYLSVPTRSDLQIIRLDVIGVTRPEAVNQVDSWRGNNTPQAMPMMAKSFASAMGASSPVEGEEKSVTATISMKIRF